MKRWILVLSAAFLLIGGCVHAENFIGLYADSQGHQCHVDVPANTPTEVWIMAIVPDLPNQMLTAAEFRVTGMPEDDPVSGRVTIDWASPLIIGTLDGGVALAFESPVAGPVVPLARLTFHDYQGNWLEDDMLIEVLPSLTSNRIAVVDAAYQVWPATGDRFTLNCAATAPCECITPACGIQPLAHDYGEVGIGYTVDRLFTVSNQGTEPLAGEVSVVDGYHSEHFSIPGETVYDLAAGETFDFNVRYAPIAAGVHDAVIDTGDNTCSNVAVAGEGFVPCMIYPAVDYDYGSLAVGLERVAVFQVRNMGVDTFAGEIELLSPHFTLLSGGGPYELMPSQTRSISIAYNPLTVATHEATVTTGAWQCGDILLRGTGTPGSGPELQDHVGLYMSAQGFGCNADIETSGVNLHLLAMLDIHSETPLVGVRFSVENLPDQSAGGIYSFAFPEAELTGNPATGATLLFDEPRTGEIIELGEVAFLPLSSDWIGPDHLLRIVGENGEGGPVLLPLHTSPLEVGNPYFTVNCTYEPGCGCFIHELPECVVEPAELDFGTVLVGETEDREFVITNTAGGTLHGLVAENSLHYALLAGGGAFSLAPTESRTVRVRFAPAFGGVHELEIDLNSPRCGGVACDGFGETPDPICEVMPDTLDFGAVGIGGSAELAFSVTNIGTGYVAGTLPGQCGRFFVNDGDPLSFNIAGGDTLAVPVSFRPLDTGPHACLLAPQVGDDCVQVFLTGDAFDPPPLCEMTPDALDFGEVDVGGERTRQVVIRNAGGQALAGHLALASEEFAITEGGGDFSLGADETRQVSVRFAPAGVGPRSAALQTGTALCGDLPVSGTGAPAMNAGEHIGIYADEAATLCAQAIVSLQPDTVFIVADVSCFANDGITGATFAVAGLPESGGAGDWSVEWLADTATGDIATGVTLGFAEPRTGEHVQLGRIRFLSAMVDWPGDDVLLEVVPGDGEVTVSDHLGDAWRIAGGICTLNCTDSEGCPCPDYTLPICALTPDSLNFGTIVSGHPDTLDFTITNAGYGTLTGCLQAQGNGFLLVAGGGDFALDHGESVHGKVRFFSIQEGLHTGSVLTGVEECLYIPCTGTVPQNFGDMFVGLFADTESTVCDADLVPYTTTPVYITAYASDFELDGIMGAKFRIDHLPDNPGYPLGSWIVEWDAPYVDGDLDTGIQVMFATPQTGAFIRLGTLQFTPFDDDWIGETHEMTTEAVDGDMSPIIYDATHEPVQVGRGRFTFNCEGPFCECGFVAMPVAVSSFALEARSGAVAANWRTEDIAEFELEGGFAEGGETWPVACEMTTPGSWRALDTNVRLSRGGEFRYTLRGRQAGEAWMMLGTETVSVSAVPRMTRLLSPHPNPFNPTLVIPYEIGEAGPARLRVYDVAGRLVRVLTDESLPAGSGSVTWHGLDDRGEPVSTGVYFINLETAAGGQTRKVVLLR